MKDEPQFAPVGRYNLGFDENGKLIIYPTYMASRTVNVGPSEEYINPEFIVYPHTVKQLVDDKGKPAFSTDTYNIVHTEKHEPLNSYQGYLESKGVAPKDVQVEHLMQRQRANDAAERSDLSPFFANLMTGMYATAAQEGWNNIKNGNHFIGAAEVLSPLMFGENAWNKVAQGIYGGIQLLNENGVPKTWKEIKRGNYRRATLSGAGDLFNLALAGVGGNQIYKSTLNQLASKGNTWARAKLVANALDNFSPAIEPQENNVYIIENVGTSKQPRMFSEGTYPIYTGPKHNINEVINPDGTINPRSAMRIQHEVANYFKQFGRGAYKMEERLENPEWHTLDPNTYLHTKNVAQTAYQLPTPPGFTKQDQMVAALGHDFGKIVSGDGHGEVGAALIKQIFPDATSEQLAAIAEHMQSNPQTILGQYTKAADVINGRGGVEVLLDQGEPGLYNIITGNKATIGPIRGIEGTPRITEENAMLISPDEWTAAQDAAIARGDIVEAQRLRDLHFRVYAPDTKILDERGNPIHSYHGTGVHFNIFDTIGKYSTLDEGYYGKGSYFAPNRELAQMYADTEKTPIVYDTYLNIKNPLRHIRDENADLYGKTIINNDGVISKLPNDLVDESFDMTEFVATKPNQIKLADAVTYDDNGIRIPLGERDNFVVNDIRYFTGPSGQLAPRPVSYLSVDPKENPLIARMSRLAEKEKVGDVYPNQRTVYSQTVDPRHLRKTIKEISPDLTENQLDQAVQIVMANRRGSHLSFGNNVGETTGGISVVDVEEAIKYLKEKGIANPTSKDLNIMVGHEKGHGVKLTKEALDAVKGFENPEEFYTLFGQVLDDAGITSTKQMPLQFDQLLKLGDNYLKKGNLDNGVRDAINFLKRFKGDTPMDKVKQRKIMSLINRFSIGAFGIYTIPKLLSDNGKIQ